MDVRVRVTLPADVAESLRRVAPGKLRHGYVADAVRQRLEKVERSAYQETPDPAWLRPPRSEEDSWSQG